MGGVHRTVGDEGECESRMSTEPIHRSRRRARGGKNGFEPRPTIRARERDVWERATAGQTQREIADALGISQPAVSNILRRVEDDCTRSLRDEVHRRRVRHLARYDHLYRQSMRGWERSQADGTRQRQIRDAGESGVAGRQRSEIEVKRRDRNPHFLSAATRRIRAADRIAGLTAAKAPLMAPEANRPLMHATDAELREEFRRHAADFGLKVVDDDEGSSPTRCEPLTRPPGADSS